MSPRSVRAWPVNSTTIRVQWDGLTPCTQVNGHIVSYRVEYRGRNSGERGNKDQPGEWDVKGAETLVTGLSPYTNYSIRVAAVNQQRDVGLYSNPIVVQTAQDGKFILSV